MTEIVDLTRVELTYQASGLSWDEVKDTARAAIGVQLTAFIGAIPGGELEDIKLTLGRDDKFDGVRLVYSESAGEPDRSFSFDERLRSLFGDMEVTVRPRRPLERSEPYGHIRSGWDARYRIVLSHRRASLLIDLGAVSLMFANQQKLDSFCLPKIGNDDD